MLLHPHLAHHPADGRTIEVEELGNLRLCLLTSAYPRDRLLLLFGRELEPTAADATISPSPLQAELCPFLDDLTLKLVERCYTAGNGSLMRLVPVPLAYRANPELAIDYAGKSSRTTHGGPAAIYER